MVKGKLNIPSNRLKNDGNKLKLSVYISDVTEDGNSYNLKCEDANFSDQDKLYVSLKTLKLQMEVHILRIENCLFP